MSTLELSTVTVPAASMGPANPLPPLRRLRDFHAGLEAGVADAEMAANLEYGHVTSLLPYTLQDGYDRERLDTPLRVAVLDNGILRAEVLLDLGGRLYSLRHLPSGRELLHRNPILQPANLGLRNAWFAGGIEWNIGTIGHTPLGCTPVHAARIDRPDGTPVLRMWEFERLRELVYSVELWLPDGSPVLYAHVRVVNPNQEDAPLYWWTNIAVPETANTRIVTPADSAYHFTYDNVLHRIRVPVAGGIDETYPGRRGPAADFFYDLGDHGRPYIAALDADGAGFVQTSTAGLRGRKLFRWGTSIGGRNWQEWLSGPGAGYLEVQASPARTQLEHLRMPAGATWSWVEAFGLLACDPADVHGRWAGTRAAVGEALDALAPAEALDAALALATAQADEAPGRLLHRGTGWGALQRRLREHHGDRSLRFTGTPFGDDTIGRDQQSWVRLIDSGYLPTPAPELPPASYTVGPAWRELLEKAAAGASGNWFSWLHVGVSRYHAGDTPAARAAWTRSLGAQVNAWALRNLAVLDLLGGDLMAAAERLLSAHRMAPRLRALTVETLEVLIIAGRPGDALSTVDRLDQEQRWHGRIRLLECHAALDFGDLARAKRLLDDGIVVDDLREGEDALDTLWWTYHEKRAAAGIGPLDPAARVRIRREHPLPCLYDYRMHETG
ncbi:DUF5107 domain-containing protein [Dactylosporangium siamense]|uniref:DUF5107 domain-containing protein n=1 Tax=Dactylosporangium siamense TaxID=685454 RepID=A0A919PT16_9ACTN|nr:DUF5107 domain-containing protein [Dactylosporangium siamense]GIG49624.1 hypothetical protein Dsi01nite_076650 [Dactylosporangium siamense]